MINDYKTNKNLPPEDKDQYREQLTLYAHGIQQKYGKYLKSIKARLHYLHFSLLDEREISQESVDAVVSKYSNAIDKIEHARFEYNMGAKTTAFPTKQNPYCKYCEYQMVCPLWQHLNCEDETVDAGEL
ncbi:PD-(D/E)XK nuclease family protein [bacterium]|nr:PD-(D/E)XK nuclease family protein [bacterium]